MLKEYNVKGENQLCFIVKEGEVNDIVLPIKYLQPIDYQRLVKMEEVGGELMKVMRDNKLENGNNALIQFQHLLLEYRKPTDEKVAPKKTIRKSIENSFFDTGDKDDKPTTGRNKDTA